MGKIIKYFWFFFPLFFPLIINGQIVWHQTDWTNERYEYLRNVDAEASPGELILENDPSNMLLAFTPTQLAGVWDIEEYDGKLFLAACTLPMAVNGGEIYCYDFASNSVQFQYEVWEQGVIQMRAANNKLYVPGLDSQGSWQAGNIYIYENSLWTRKETVPNALHVLDLIFFQNNMLVTAERLRNNISSGTVYHSTNEGNLWDDLFSVYSAPLNLSMKSLDKHFDQNDHQELLSADSRRLLMMGEYRGKLYVQGDLKQPQGKVLFCYDGQDWSTISLEQLVFSYSIFKTFNNKLYFLNKNFMHIFDGDKWDSVALPFSGGVIARSLAQYNGYLFSGAENGRLYKSHSGYQWTQESVLGNGSDEIESIAVFHGRLYVGTNGSQGKVFVSAALPEGYLESEKHDFGGKIASGEISWQALMPTTSTSVLFQIKTAATEQELDKKELLGPDNTSHSYYSTSGENISSFHWGDQWMQYKVVLSTNNNVLMPVLQDVTFSMNLSNSAKNISGSVVYHTTNIPVNDVELTLSGNFTSSTKSNSNGYFEFTNLESGKGYAITPSKEDDIFSNTISAYDAALTSWIAIHFITTPTADQFSAADIDQNGAVQMYDAAMIARYAVGLPDLPGCRAGNWVFNPVTCSYQTSSSDVNETNFTAIVLGHVDGSWFSLNNLDKISTDQKLFDRLSRSVKMKDGEINLPFLPREANISILSISI